ncbi:protein maelstrom homolog [Bufo bufo]|uniref:protein maelstrom homolog n=1 Tax=Bufo bufo TaxID=8384 RepID=UPI001ABEB5B5|nr:protein maelstrom homolog [Bufo bufo]
MPNKRASRNAYFFFALDMIPELRRRGFCVAGVKEAIPLCSGEWALLSFQERQKYAEKAKEWKSRDLEPPRPSADNEKGLRFNYQVEGEQRGQDRYSKSREGIFQHQYGRHVTATTSNQLLHPHVQHMSPHVIPCKHDLMGNESIGDAKTQQNLIDLEKCVIYVIDIFSHGQMPSLCEQRFVPCEIGCVRYSLQDGIIDSFHDFIDPGELPLGFRYYCHEGSSATHQIPVSGFELANRDYHNLFRSLCDFVRPAAKRSTSVYCRSNDIYRVKWSLNWLAVKAGIENIFELQDIESLIIKLFKNKLEEEPSKSSVLRLLGAVKWDFASNTRCKWHEDNDMWCCALASCKKATYSISSALASVYGVVLTPSHLPNLQANNNQKCESETIVLNARRYQKKTDRPHQSENGNSVGAVGGDSLGMRGVGSTPPTSKARGRGILRLLEEMPAPYATSK